MERLAAVIPTLTNVGLTLNSLNRLSSAGRSVPQGCWERVVQFQVGNCITTSAGDSWLCIELHVCTGSTVITLYSVGTFEDHTTLADVWKLFSTPSTA